MMSKVRSSGPEDDAVLVVGGGVAGLCAARALSALGREVTLVERASRLGGRVLSSPSVFPSMLPGEALVAALLEGLETKGKVTVWLESRVVDVARSGAGFEAKVEAALPQAGSGLVPPRLVRAGAVILATGLEPTDPGQIPELGHGRLGNVVTSVELEAMLRSGRLRGPGEVRVGSVAFVQCVGSRVEYRGVPHCSAVCCMNAIKSALAIKEMDDSIDVYVLYIDVRTHGKGQEALYRRARRMGVRFIRGQPSMVVGRSGSGQALVCGENTLLKELYEIPADLVVLSVGLRARPEDEEMLEALGVRTGEGGLPENAGGEGSPTSVPGVFVAGCLEAPKDARESMSQGEAAALAAHRHLLRRGRERA